MKSCAGYLFCALLPASFFLAADTVRVRDVSNGQREQLARDAEQWTVDGTNRSTDQKCYPTCRCHGDEEDCSRHFGRLTFVPKIPDRLSFMNFSYNNLTSVSSDDFFLNVTHITGLDLGNNGLTTISPGAFRPLSRLVHLLMSHNYHLTYDRLRPVLSIRKLIYLDLRHGTLPLPPADLFVRYPLPRLELLYLHSNVLRNTNMSVFTPLKRLRTLGLAGNYISVLITDYFPALRTLHVGDNSLSDFPRTCMQNGSSLFPVLGKLILISNRLAAIGAHVCLPSLWSLNLKGNVFKVFTTDQFHSNLFPVLEELYLSSMHRTNQGIDKYAFRNKYLKTISLMFENIKFSDVHNESFAGCPNLSTLVLSHNYFDKLTEAMFFQLFGSLSHLQTLFLGVGKLQKLSAKMLSGFRSLKKLFLHQNQITYLPDGVVDDLVNLTVLVLDSNQITVVRETTFSPATLNRLRQLDLSGNPFDCSCDLRWFQNWLASGPKALKNPRYKYTCSNLPDTNVTSFYLSDQACLLSRDTNVLMVSCLSLLLAVMTTVFPLYRYRWHLRLMLYEAVRGGGDARQRRLQRGQFQYDVYMSYASDDLGWVRQHLLAELENWGLRVCLHDRDFLIGNNIVDDISHSVESSKKVLVVFSRHYSRNQWCQFELNFCLRHVMDFGDNLVVTCVNDVESRDLTTAMMAVLKMMSYIRWDDDPDAMAAFWGRLRQALQEILPADVQN